MSIFDISLLVILAAFIFNGLSKGLIKILGNVVALILGAYLASHFYLAFYTWGHRFVNVSANIGRILSFIILFVLTTRLANLLFILIEKLFNFIAVIPGSRYINNILGGLLGFLEGSLFLGLIIYVVSRYSLISDYLGDQLLSSVIAPFLLKIVNIILPVLPEALKALKSII
ncbi:MAG: CvpA family protein [Patescibacteria group bacterium]